MQDFEQDTSDRAEREESGGSLHSTLKNEYIGMGCSVNVAFSNSHITPSSHFLSSTQIAAKRCADQCRSSTYIHITVCTPVARPHSLVPNQQHNPSSAVETASSPSLPPPSSSIIMRLFITAGILLGLLTLHQSLPSVHSARVPGHLPVTKKDAPPNFPDAYEVCATAVGPAALSAHGIRV